MVTHPEVAVQPHVPVPQWGLSAVGRARLVHLLAQPWAGELTRVVSSTERKALETAHALAGPLGLAVQTDEDLGENDRSATGYLPPAEFDAVVEEFFARPGESVRGWEPALAAQRRFTAAVARAVSGARGDVAVVAHGGVSTLLLCDLVGVPVDRAHDQPGQGSWFTFREEPRRLVHGWRRLEAPA